MLGVGRAGPFGGSDPAEAGAAARMGGDPDAAERDAWVILNEARGVGPVSFGRLVARFGSAAAVLAEAARRGGVVRLVEATEEPGSWPSLTSEAAREIAALAQRPRELLASVHAAGVAVLTLADGAYPARLRRIALPPPVLFLAGDAAAMDGSRAVAVVGTRRPTVLGRATAARIADAVSGLGATVVSGLALGIDTAAHEAALRGGGTTVAIIGGGHQRLYPAGNRGLARRIAAAGGVVASEFSPATVPSRGTFPRRNRIVSGLSDATIVVEAGARSGALTTAAWALEQGRGLHIVPGRLDDPAVAGSLAFLREAGPEARIVTGIPELLDDLGLLGAAVTNGGSTGPDGAPTTPGHSRRAVLAALPSVERSIVGHVVDGRGSVDELVAATSLAGATVLGALTALEMRGLVVETFGRYRPAGVLAPGAPADAPVRGRPAVLGKARGRCPG